MSDSDNYWTNSDKAEEFLALASQKQKETFNDLVHYVKTNPSGATKFVLARCIECGTLYGVKSYLRNRVIKEPCKKTVKTPKQFSNFAEGRLQKHFDKHVIERGEWGNQTISIEEYLRKTRELINSPVGGNIDGFVSKGGYTFRYNKITNEFTTAKPNGIIETFYRPKVGLVYWQEQIAKYK